VIGDDFEESDSATVSVITVVRGVHVTALWCYL